MVGTPIDHQPRVSRHESVKGTIYGQNPISVMKVPGAAFVPKGFSGAVPQAQQEKNDADVRMTITPSFTLPCLATELQCEG